MCKEKNGAENAIAASSLIDRYSESAELAWKICQLSQAVDHLIHLW